jgi:uncharacterized protein
VAGAPTLGIPQLDGLVGPIPRGASMLLLSDPGVEAEVFLYQAAHESLDKGRPVLYLVTNRAPSSVLEAMAEHGFPERGPSEGLRFIDAFSALLGSREDADYSVSDPTKLETLTAVVRQAVKEHPDAIVVLDGLSTLIDNAGGESFMKALAPLLKALKSQPFALATLTKWPYEQGIEPMTKPFDAIITVKGVENRILYSQFFALERAAWIRTPDTRPRLFKVIKPGGVFVYIPKIVVTGPHNAGKSTFVQTVSDTAVSVDRMGTTVALDHGQVIMDGLAADLFGTPGQERFDPILSTIAGQALGVVIVVDATRPDTFARAKEMMQLTWKEGLAAVIVANKQDQAGALSVAEVAKKINAPKNVPVLGCRGNDRESSRAALRTLIDRILQGVAVA